MCISKLSNLSALQEIYSTVLINKSAANASYIRAMHEIIKFFISIAKYLRELHNYLSLSAEPFA